MVAEQVQRELVNEPLVFVDERGAGFFVARGAPLDQRRLATPDVLPGKSPNWFHREFLGHFTTPLWEAGRRSLEH
jgi:hypothetical protein